MVKAALSRIQHQISWREEPIKNVQYMLGVVINLEKYLYSRFDVIQELIKEIVFRRNEIT
jgi:hypothetical protein